MKVLISGGGTGGHINPALAIANYIKEKENDVVIEYVGTKKGLETSLVPKEGYKIHYVDVSGFKRQITLENIKVAFKAITSVFQAKRIIKAFAPDVVIGTGGYVCWPVIKAASEMKIPNVIHEQNAFPGLTVRKSANITDIVMISFKESCQYFKSSKNILFVGNPVKKEMLTYTKEQERQKLNIPLDATVLLSYGGSLGAKKINENVFELIRSHTSGSNIFHFHATGAREYDEYCEKYKALGFEEVQDGELKKNNVTIKRYIYDMPSYLASCDAVICRAGAMTLSELAVMGKAAVIIPSPNVTNNHQYKNAKVLCDANAALMIEESELDSEALWSKVALLVNNPEERHTIENNVREYAVYDSLERIYKAVKVLTK